MTHTNDQNLYRRFMANVLAGMFLMLPIAVILIVASKFFQMAIAPARRIATALGIERPFLIELFLVVLLILLCFICGLLMHAASVKRFRDQMENGVLRFVPGYEYVKLRLTMLTGEKEATPLNRAVLVKIDDGWSPALLVEEHEDGRSVVYVPDVPKSDSGSIYLVDQEQVRYLSVKFSQLDLAIRNYGKGLGKIVRDSETRVIKESE